MHTFIVLVFAEMRLEVKEGYQTIKNRLANSADFFEVTTKQGKMTLSKKAVEWVAPLTEKPILMKKEGKHDATKKA